VKFHDGTPLNAEAVKFSMSGSINTSIPAYKLGKYPFANFFSAMSRRSSVEPERVALLLKDRVRPFSPPHRRRRLHCEPTRS